MGPLPLGIGKNINSNPREVTSMSLVWAWKMQSGFKATLHHFRHIRVTLTTRKHFNLEPGTIASSARTIGGLL